MTISVITPSFRQLDWLKLCVASVRDQVDEKAESGKVKPESHILSQVSPSLLAVEHIIQDAGSPGIEDFAREVGADFYKEGNLVFRSQVSDFSISRYRIAVYCESDSGMYDAINRGLARSSGEICAWLNSDEQYLENALAKVAGLLSSNPKVDVLLGDAILVNAGVEPVCYRRIMVPSRWHTRLDHLHSLSCAMFFRRAALPSPPLNTRWKVIGDTILMDFWLDTRKQIIAVGEPLSVYAFTGSNLSSNPDHGEHSCWRAQLKSPPPVFRRLVVLTHRIRRLFHGAYGKFVISARLYTPLSPFKRVLMVSTVPGTWPEAQ